MSGVSGDQNPTDNGEEGQWQVRVDVGTTVYVTVDAQDEESAIEAAYEAIPGICAQCSGWGKDYSRDEWEPDWDNATAEHSGRSRHGSLGETQ